MCVSGRRAHSSHHSPLPSLSLSLLSRVPPRWVYHHPLKPEYTRLGEPLMSYAIHEERTKLYREGARPLRISATMVRMSSLPVLRIAFEATSDRWLKGKICFQPPVARGSNFATGCVRTMTHRMSETQRPTEKQANTKRTCRCARGGLSEPRHNLCTFTNTPHTLSAANLSHNHHSPQANLW